jgi:pimeloyl-ACP methyl ester carboxylesterase
VPDLNLKHLSVNVVQTEQWGKLEAFVPTDPRYQCKNSDAPTLLLIPGLGMDGSGFLRQLPLGATSHLHLFLTPNGPAKGETGLNCYARYVEEYILAQKLDSQPGGLLLGGCSMGGSLSLAVALRGRVKIRGLVLIGTFGSCQHLPRWQRIAAPLARVIPMALFRALAWTVVAHTPIFGKVTPAEAHWMVSYRTRPSHRYYHTAVMGLTRQEQIEQARTLKIPTIVLHGTRDNVLPYAAGVVLAEAIPNAKFEAVDDAGHTLFFTHYQPVNDAIGKFMSGLPAPICI